MLKDVDTSMLKAFGSLDYNYILPTSKTNFSEPENTHRPTISTTSSRESEFQRSPRCCSTCSESALFGVPSLEECVSDIVVNVAAFGNSTVRARSNEFMPHVSKNPYKPSAEIL